MFYQIIEERLFQTDVMEMLCHDVVNGSAIIIRVFIRIQIHFRLRCSWFKIHFDSNCN